MTAENGAPKVGDRLRQARREQGMTLAELAERSGLTKGFLSQVERDLASLSVGSLVRVCEALDIPVHDLLEIDQGALVRWSDRAPINFGGENLEEFRLTPTGDKRLLVIQSVIAPGGGSGSDPYGLDSSVEFVHVLEGRLLLEVTDERYVLSAGDSLTFEPRAERRWHNPSTVLPACVLWVLVQVP
ncbi:MAG: helix-turn-helix transcriptional regulator [Actinobacteria bacterium]|nr:helix-turn-helix transcriptional regulator [Actinomycetota bacterium]